MNNFTFYSPTEVVFGKDTERLVTQEIQKFKGSRVLIVYGGGSVVKSGLLGTIKDMLGKEKLPFIEISGVQPNPRLSLTKKGIEKAIDFKADFILAVGGGSVIDTAKGIAIGAANPGVDIWRFWTAELVPQAALPVGVVLTISAAGSETSDSAVLTNDELASKRGLGSPLNRPKFAIMNPELTFTLPKYQVGCGVVDIMMHTLDRYFTPTEGNELTDQMAEALLRVVIEQGPIAIKNPRDYRAMSEIMWCGSVSHNGLTGLGAVTDFATHQLGHELSAKFDVAHGASLSATWPSWASFVYMEKPERFARYAQRVWNIDKGGIVETAKAGIERTVEYFSSLDMPVCFSDLDVGVQDDGILRELADRCVFYGKRTIGKFKVLDRDAVYRIYSAANH